MRQKPIASFMLVIAISTVTLFAGEANAMGMVGNKASAGGPVTETALASATNGTTSSEACCSGWAMVTFQNYTPWRIRCYVDGTSVGVVYPGSSLSAWVWSGWARPYGRAGFLDGSSLSWDSGDLLYLAGGSYAFPMYP